VSYDEHVKRRTAGFIACQPPGKVLIMASTHNGEEVGLQQLRPQAVLSTRATVQIAQLGEAMDDSLRALWGYLQRGAQPAGPPYVRYHTFGETETDLEIGVPVVEAVAGEGRITAGELPGGPAVTTWHLGPHDKLGDAYARIQAWLKDHGREPDGPAWEVYYWIDLNQDYDPSTWAAPSDWRMQLVQPVK
jgi:effector-binding domain-containing protein